MSEQFLREIAERFGLTVLKRITTGTAEKGCFATFELSGAPDRLQDAWACIRPNARRGFDAITWGNVPGHKDYGKAFIECQSVWVDGDGVRRCPCCQKPVKECSCGLCSE